MSLVLNRMRAAAKGADGPIVPVLLGSAGAIAEATRAPPRSVSSRTDCIPAFAAIYVGDVPTVNDKSTMRIIIPFNIKAIAREGAVLMTTENGDKVPLYSPSTEDGAAVKYNVLPIRGEPAPGQKKRPVTFQKLDPNVLYPGTTFAEGCAAALSEWKNTAAAKPPVPFTLVKVYNATLSYYKNKLGNDTMSMNADSLQSEPFAEFNALPLSVRLPFLFSPNRQSMPAVADFLPLAPKLRSDFVAGGAVISSDADSTVARKAKAAYMRALMGNLVPYALFSANSPYELGTFKNSQEAFTIAPLDFAKLLDEKPTREFATNVALVGKTLFRPATDPQKDKDKLEFDADFICSIYDDGALTHRQYFPGCKVFASAFADFPVYYPSWIQQLFDLHPIPFHVLLGANISETLEDDRNGRADPYYPQGLMSSQVQAFEIEFGRHLERQGIPCTRSLLVKRYGNETPKISVLPSSPIAEELERFATQRKKVFEKSKNEGALPQESVEELLYRDGIAGFDTMQMRVLPPADDANVVYYAINLFPLVTQPPRAKLPDPREPGFDAEFLTEAVNLTPEDGDKFILSSLPKTPTDTRDAWLQKRPGPLGVPYYLFFAVNKSKPVVLSDALKQQLRELLCPTGNVVKPDPTVVLPADVDDLRRHAIAQIMGLAPPAAAAAAAAVPVPSPEAEVKVQKRERESDESDESTERAKKRARTDAPPVPVPVVEDDPIEEDDEDFDD
jgi:hypothetical protein